MRIGVIRHAEPYPVRLERGGLNPGLTTAGIKQAMELGESGQLSEFKWMFTSSARRAFETGLILCGYTHLTPNVVHDLGFVRIDRRLIGDLAGAIQNTPSRKWPVLWTQTRWGGLETPEAFVERIKVALREIIRQAAGDNVLIVAHEETFWAIMAIVEGISIEEAIKRKYIEHAQMHVFELKGNI